MRHRTTEEQIDRPEAARPAAAAQHGLHKLQQSAGNAAIAQLLAPKNGGDVKSMAQEGRELAEIAEDRSEGKKGPKPKVTAEDLPKAPKDADVKESDGGWIRYAPMDSAGRASGAMAVLTPGLKAHGSAASSSIQPTGWNGNKQRKFGRGHLVGKQLGGTGKDPRNLVTLFQTTTNTPWMTNVENPLASLVAGGEKILYEVTPVYDGDSPTCHTVRMTTVGTKGTYKVNELVENRELKEAERLSREWTEYHKVEFRDGRAVSLDPRRNRQTGDQAEQTENEELDPRAKAIEKAKQRRAARSGVN